MLPVYMSPRFTCWHHRPSYCGLLFERNRVRIFVIWVTTPCSFYITHLQICTEYITQKITLINLSSAEGANPSGNKKIYDFAVVCVAPVLEHNESLRNTWCVQVLRSPKEAFAAAMQSWRERCEICVCLQGDYVEKWLHFQLPVVSSFFK